VARRKSEAGRFNANGSRLNGQALLERALADLGARQWGVFTLAHLRALGLSARAIQNRAETGRLHRHYRGVYSLVPANLLTRNGRFLAAVYAAGDGAALACRHAAALHELRGTDSRGIDVVVPTRATRIQPGLNIHRSTTLTAKDLTTVDGIPCTTIPRTLLDLADRINRRALERALDQAEILEKLDLRALQDQIERNRTRRAARILKAVLAEHHPGSTLTRSNLEDRFLEGIRRSGLPAPEVNAWVDFADGEPPIQPDFLWRAQRVIVETDGYKTHKTRYAFERDRRNARRATRAGWNLIRTTDRDIEDNLDEVIHTVLVSMNG
jgi:hypothetical protein